MADIKQSALELIGHTPLGLYGDFYASGYYERGNLSTPLFSE